MPQSWPIPATVCCWGQVHKDPNLLSPLRHAHSGVEKGVKSGGKPVEVMGLMAGRPSYEVSSPDAVDRHARRDHWRGLAGPAASPPHAKQPLQTCHQDPREVIITDCFEVPVDGFETRVVADDEVRVLLAGRTRSPTNRAISQDVTNYMISIGETLEMTQQERLIGWCESFVRY